MFNKIKTLCILASANLINFVWATDCDAYGGVEVINGIPQISTTYISDCQAKIRSDSFDETGTNVLVLLLDKRNFVIAAGVVICVISLVIGATELAMSAGNQQNKQKAWGRIKISLIALAIIGSIGTLVNIFINIF